MELGDLVAAALPGDPAVVRDTAERLAEMVAEAARVRGGLEFGLDLTKPKPGEAPDPRRAQGLAALERLRAEEAAARARHDELLAFADRLAERRAALADVQQDLNERTRGLTLLPVRLADGPGPWWACTRVSALLGPLAGLDAPSEARPVAVGTPALVDALYLALSRWRAEPDAARPFPDAPSPHDTPLRAFLTPGTTITPSGSVIADDTAPLPDWDAAATLLPVADTVVVSAVATAQTLALSQAWLAAPDAVLAVGDGETIRLRRLPSHAVPTELVALTPLPQHAPSVPDAARPFAVTRDLVERMLAPDAVVRTRAADALAAELPVLGAATLASVLTQRAWTAWAVAATHRNDGVADGAAHIALVAAEAAWLARADGERAVLEPIAADALADAVAGLVRSAE